MNATTHPEAERYLKELDRALADLPRARRRELVDEIRSHIDEATPPRAAEAEVRTVLDELGDPEIIAADARERFGIETSKAGPLEGFAIALLLVGGVVVPIVGWIVGVVLLWISRAWTLRDKIAGTLLVPGGLGLPVYFGFFATGVSSSCEAVPAQPGPRGEESVICSTQRIGPELWGTLLLVLLVVVPIGMAIYLGRRAFRTRTEG